MRGTDRHVSPSVLTAVVSMEQINDTLTSSDQNIAMMLLIIGGGGAFKQVLVDSGMD